MLSWSDNSTWGYTNWAMEKGVTGNDDYIRMGRSSGRWYKRTAQYEYAFICQLPGLVLSGHEKREFIYKKDQLTFRSFHVWYEYKAASQQVLDDWEDKRMTGFKLTWRIEKSALVTNSSGQVFKHN